MLHEEEQADSEPWPADPRLAKQARNEKTCRVIDRGSSDRDREVKRNAEYNSKPASLKRSGPDEPARDALEKMSRRYCVG